MPVRPWYARHPDEYRRATAHLSLEEHGALTLLLDYAWEHHGFIPDDPRALMEILNVSPYRFKKVFRVVSKFFHSTGKTFEADGKIFLGLNNKWIEREMAQIAELADIKRQAARTRWDARASEEGMHPHMQVHMHVHQELVGDSSGSPDPEEPGERKKKGVPMGPPKKKEDGPNGPDTKGSPGTAKRFREWYATYPKKRKRADAEKVWRAQSLDDKADELIADVARRRQLDQRWRDGFIPDPPVYLRGKRWEDELGTPHPNDRRLTPAERGAIAMKDWED